MKKVIGLLLVFVLAMGICPVLAEEDWTYENGVLYLSGTGEANVPKLDIELTQLKRLVIGKDITNLDYIISALSGNEYYWWVEEIEVNEENPYFSSLDGVLFNKDRTVLIKFPPCKNGEYTMPESVEEIDSRAFMRAVNVTSVVINDRVTQIESGTFSQCRNLESITIPKSVVRIEDGAFSGGDTNMVGQHPTPLKEINYKGTYAQWSRIEKGASYNYHRMNITAGGDLLKEATKHFADTYITFGGKRIELTQPMYANYDRVMVPLEDMCIAMGYSVEWDSAAWGVRAIKGDTQILFPIFPDNNHKGEVYDVYYIDGSGESVVTQNSYQLYSLNGGWHYEDVYHHSILTNGKAMASVKLVEKVFGNSVEYSETEGVTLFDITNKAEYISTYDDCTVAVYENAVWAWGGDYGEIPIKLLDNIKELKAIRRSFSSYSYYAICEDNSLYVWGAHGSYANMMPSSKPSKYTYVGGMLGLPCNTNVKPSFDGPSEWIDWSKYNDASPDQKTPVKLLDNVKKVVTGSGKIVTLGVNGEVYIWGEYSGANRNGDYAPKLINSNAEEIYVTGTSPALSDGKIGVLEKGGSFAVYSGSHVQERMDNVLKVFGTMYIASYTPAFLVLTEEGKAWELKSGKTLVMENVTGFEEKSGVIYIKTADGSVYERVMDGAGYKIQLTDKEIEFEDLILKDISIYVDGKKVVTDVAPYIKNDRVLVPMRAIFEVLGTGVSWNDETKTANAYCNGVTIRFTAGTNYMYKNGEAIKLDAPAEITNGRTMVPVRAISEAFGCTVEWDNDMRCVKITK